MYRNLNQKFGNKLVIHTMTVCSIAVILACLSFTIFQLSRLRPNALRTAQSIAQMTAIHCYAAVAFDDQQALHETLTALKAIPEIEWVNVSNATGQTLDEYTNKNVSTDHTHSHGHHFSEINLRVPIMHNKQIIGILELHYDLKPALKDLAYEFVIILLIGFAAVGLAALFAVRKHHELIRPIHALTSAAYAVRDTGNYGVRVSNIYDEDEVGMLIDVFNSMLEKVQHAYDELEKAVEDRTHELNRALDQAMAASQAKSLFLANMSHEIRTPMTAILGFSDILQDENLPHAERVKFLQTIERNGKHLLTIINDILDISKIEAQQMQIETIPTKPLDILHDVQSLMQVKAHEKNIQLNVQILAPFPKVIHSDPIRIRQVLMNLLSNAIKFTEQGQITLTAKLTHPTDMLNTRICFEVQDTGIGLSPKQVTQIFKPFTQADETTTRRFGGTGLGLAISRKLASLLGGDLSVTSREGFGSCFSFTISSPKIDNQDMIHKSGSLGSLMLNPREEYNTTQQVLTLENKVVLNGCRILLAEDGIDNQKLISMLLKRAGAELTCVENGQMAVDAIQQSQVTGTPYDLILMDMQMPVMDGYTATRQLRHEGHKLPIVALTANAMNQDRQACLKAGCDDYMTKPVNKKLLQEIILRHVPRIQANNERAA